MLNLTVDQLQDLMPDALGDHMDMRQLLAVKIANALLLLVTPSTAVTAAFTASQGATVGGHRLLVIAAPLGKLEAFWREDDAAFAVICPFVAIPADAWITALSELLDDHRRSAGRRH